MKGILITEPLFEKKKIETIVRNENVCVRKKQLHEYLNIVKRKSQEED